MPETRGAFNCARLSEDTMGAGRSNVILGMGQQHRRYGHSMGGMVRCQQASKSPAAGTFCEVDVSGVLEEAMNCIDLMKVDGLDAFDDAKLPENALRLPDAIDCAEISGFQEPQGQFIRWDGESFKITTPAERWSYTAQIPFRKNLIFRNSGPYYL